MSKFKESPRGVQLYFNDALDTGLLFGAGKFAHTGYKGVKSVIPGGKTAVAIFGESTYLEKPLLPPLRQDIINEVTGVNLGYNKDLISLNEKIAKESQRAQKGVIIAGPRAKSDKKFKDAPRIVAKYGGKIEDWVKKSSSSYQPKVGEKIETHWVENLKTGERVEFKFKDFKK